MKKILVSMAILPGMWSVNSFAIVDGEIVTDTTAKSRVAIRSSEMAELPHCTGTLVAPNWVLTAAHCLVFPLENGDYKVLHPSDLSISVRSITLTGVGTGDVYVPSHVIIYPKYTRFSESKLGNDNQVELEALELDHDVALIRLENSVRISGVSPVTLASNDEMKVIEGELNEDWKTHNRYNERNENVVGYGWGFTDANASVATDSLRKGNFTFYPTADCYVRLTSDESFPALMGGPWNTSKICTLPSSPRDLGSAVGTLYGVHVCNGDSGGPLMYERNGKNIQIGIASGVPLLQPNCGSYTKPAFYAKVSTYYEWIQSYVANDKIPSEKVVLPDVVIDAREELEHKENCKEGISTRNCDFKQPDGASSPGLWVLMAIGLLGWIRRK